MIGRIGLGVKVDNLSDIRVAVVDNDRASVNFGKKILESLGVTVVAACRTGADAVKSLLNQDLHIIMVPPMLDDMGAGEFLRRIASREEPPDVLFLEKGDPKVFKTTRQLAEAHGFRILGTLDRPLKKDAISSILNVFSPAQKAKRDQTRRLTPLTADEISDGIAENYIYPVFQPKVEIKTGKVIGVECLARWRDPKRGELSPGAFIPVAEEQGLMRPLTRSIFQQAMAVAGVWQVEDIDLKISVNVTADNLEEEDFPEFIVRAAEDEGIHPKKIILEITESRIMGDIKRPLEAISKLSHRGVSLSIDDFGTGYSSLQQLQRIPASELKVDRAFVYEAWKDDEKRTILRSSIELGHQLGMSITAEGAETLEDWRLLEELGCDVVQGFFCSRPMPGREFRMWLQDWKAPKPATENGESKSSVFAVPEKISEKLPDVFQEHKRIFIGAAAAIVISVGALQVGSIISSNDVEILETSIAVLPFRSPINDSEQQIFASGLSEQILYELARNPSLKVAPRSSSFLYVGQDPDLGEVRRALGVAHVLSGSIQRSGNRIRITAALVETATGNQLWSQRFDEEGKDIFALQDAISAAVSAALREYMPGIAVAPKIERIQSVEHAKAHELYVAAVPRIRERGLDNLQRARELLEEAVQTAPDHAEARAELATVYLLLESEHQAIPAEEAYAKAASQVTEALSKAPNSTSVMTAIGRLERAQGSIEEAEVAFLKAIELDPKNAEAYLQYGLLERHDRANLDAAMDLFTRAIEADPLAPAPAFERAAVDTLQGRFDRARDELTSLLRLYPDFLGAKDMLAKIESQTGHLVEAIRLFRGIRDETGSLDQVSRLYLSTAYTALNYRVDAAQLWRDTSAPAFLVHRNNAFVAVFEGNRPRALEEIREHQGILVDWRWKGLEAELLLSLGDQDKLLDMYRALEPRILSGESIVGDGDNVFLVELAYALSRAGDQTRALALADQVLNTKKSEEKGSEFPGFKVVDALAYALRGDNAMAISTLRGAYEKGFRNLWSYGTSWYPRVIPLDDHPIFAELRTDPEFQAIMRSIRQDLAEQRLVLGTSPAS
jgi:EAL domain-containing protein (putative c-di-GMP-specific phosphodiesterase class I)/TolB-like protein/tetratricopeptide (TPR) repeat protein